MAVGAVVAVGAGADVLVGTAAGGEVGATVGGGGGAVVGVAAGEQLTTNSAITSANPVAIRREWRDIANLLLVFYRLQAMSN